MLQPIYLIGSGRAAELALARLLDLGLRVRCVNASAPHASLRIVGSAHLPQRFEDAPCEAEVVIVAVGTSIRSDGSTDVSGLFDIVTALARVNFRFWPTVVIAARVPVGTSDHLAAAVDWGDIIFAPNLIEDSASAASGTATAPIVVGCDAPGAALNYVRVLEPLQRPMFFTSRRNAELIACCGSAHRGLEVSFANEIARICDAFGADADDVLRGIEYARRARPNALRPGIGFGTSPIGREIQSIVNLADREGAGRALLSATLEVDDGQRARIVEMLAQEVATMKGLRIGVWGLSSAEEDEEGGDAAAMRIVSSLADRGASMICYDPAVHVADLPRDSVLATSALESARADALLVLAPRSEFRSIDPNAFAQTLGLRLVIDGCNVLDPERIEAAGLKYRGVGRCRAAASSPHRSASAR